MTLEEPEAGPTIGCCELHAGASPPECPQCRADRYERLLQRLADPMSTLTPKGVIDLAHAELERGRRR